MNIAASPLRSLSTISAPPAPRRAAAEGAVEVGPSDRLSRAENAEDGGWRRLGAGAALGLVALGLTGCNSSAPTPPSAQQQTHYASLSARLEAMRNKSEGTAYYAMAEAGFNRTMLQDLSKRSTTPEAAAVRALADKAVAAFNVNGNAAEQQALTRAALTEIAGLKSDSYNVQGSAQAASFALQTDTLFAQSAGTASNGLADQLKNRVYEEALKASLSKLATAPAMISQQTGHELGLVQMYVDAVSAGPNAALAYANELGDPALASTLFRSSGTTLVQTAQNQSALLGPVVSQAIAVLGALTGGKF